MPVKIKPPMITVLGFDPGASGGVAILGELDPVVFPMPETHRDLWELVRTYGPTVRHAKDVFAFVEQVGGFMGRAAGEKGSANRASAHTMFRFGYGAGMIEAFLIAADIPYELVPPQRWQKGGPDSLGISPRKNGEGKTAWKGRLRSHAQRLFPGLRVTSATADALLIAEWGRRRLQPAQPAARYNA